MKKLFYLLLVPFILFGCQDEVEIPKIDVREAAVGEYTYTAELVYVHDRNMTDIIKGTAKAELTGVNGLKFTLDPDTAPDVLNLTGITEASNGFSFNIQSKTDGDYEYRGVNSVTLGGQEFHGSFDTGSKQIKYMLLLDDSGVDDDDFEVEFICTKK